MVFNKILISQDFFSRTNVTSQRIRRRKIHDYILKIVSFENSHFVLICIFFTGRYEDNNKVK